MLKRSLILISLSLAISACSQGEQSATETADVAEEAAGPDVNVSAAPGVAFNYRYAFRLSDAKIAAVQEEHAAACETLGLSRFRITGMRYTLVDEDEVQASLLFKLDPVIARKFGKDAITSVTKAEGILVDSAIEGVDAGAKITASQRRSADVAASLSNTEKQLAKSGLNDRERTELQQQASAMRSRLSDESDDRRADQESLATTPMEFNYSGDDGILGFGSGNPFANAAKSAISSFIWMASFVMLAIGVLLPWALLAFLLILLWRSPPLQRVRGWFKRQADLSKPSS
jgi:hypothetical protein